MKAKAELLSMEPLLRSRVFSDVREQSIEQRWLRDPIENGPRRMNSLALRQGKQKGLSVVPAGVGLGDRKSVV